MPIYTETGKKVISCSPYVYELTKEKEDKIRTILEESSFEKIDAILFNFKNTALNEDIFICDDPYRLHTLFSVYGLLKPLLMLKENTDVRISTAKDSVIVSDYVQNVIKKALVAEIIELPNRFEYPDIDYTNIELLRKEVDGIEHIIEIESKHRKIKNLKLIAAVLCLCYYKHTLSSDDFYSLFLCLDEVGLIKESQKKLWDVKTGYSKRQSIIKYIESIYKQSKNYTLFWFSDDEDIRAFRILNHLE